MKILLFTLEYPPFHGGVANYYGSLVSHWPESDQISVLNNNDGRLINNNLPFLKWLPAYFSLRQKIKREKIDHVLVGHILPLGAATLISAKFYKIKYTIFLHGLDFALAMKSGRKKWLAEKILTGAEKIICANSYVAKLAKNFLPEYDHNKITTVNPGINPNYQLPITNYQLKNRYNLAGKTILLSVGRLVKRKGFDKVIEAMLKVLEKVPDLTYIIVGSGEELKNLKFKILNLKLNNSVKIITEVSDTERDNWYNACDIFIMPSRNMGHDFEGFGMVYLEANLAGKPVIAGDSGGVRDAVVDGLNGLLVNPEDTAAIAGAIVRLAQNPELRKKLGEQGRDRAIKEFDWNNQVNKLFGSLM